MIHATFFLALKNLPSYICILAGWEGNDHDSLGSYILKMAKLLSL